jgi:hypothetical protein
MTEKKLSRRDAIKMLGVAAGAAALAGLPSKWNTPEVVAGALPAHARASYVCPKSDTLSLGSFSTWDAGLGDLPASTVVNYTVSWTGTGTMGGNPSPLSNVVAGNAFDNLGAAAGFNVGDVITEVDTFNGRTCSYTTTLIT